MRLPSKPRLRIKSATLRSWPSACGLPFRVMFMKLSGNQRPCGLTEFISGLSRKDQVPHAVPQAQAAVFELGKGAEVRAWRKAVASIFQEGFAAQYFKHLMR